ncbi:MAG TPA: hypothetical protein VMW69_15790 [Spirochaetia bacterium]|nr:hypothetical protein [Spirochaetia bacterium]
MANERGGSARNTGLFGGSYGLTIIGAAVYFIGHAGSFWLGVLGLLKALVWPAFVIYKVLELLHL